MPLSAPSTPIMISNQELEPQWSRWTTGTLGTEKIVTESWTGVAKEVYFQLQGGSWDHTSCQCRGWWSPSNSRRLVLLDLHCFGYCYDHVHQLVQKGCHRPPYHVGSNQFPFQLYVFLAGAVYFHLKCDITQYFMTLYNMKLNNSMKKITQINCYGERSS